MQVSETSTRYTFVNNKKASGATYTPKILADFVANQIVNVAKLHNQKIKILDPAIGDGQLLDSLLGCLDPLQKVDVFGFETNLNALETAKNRLQQKYPNANYYLQEGDFLNYVQQNYSMDNQLDLFCQNNDGDFDLIIANPPYVRTQILGAEKAQDLGKQFGLSGRIDLYHAFLIAMGRVISPYGIAGIIVSNRFMTTKSGQAVRKAIPELFDIIHIWDLGDTRLFDAAVLPAVLLLKGKNSKNNCLEAKFSSIYETHSEDFDYTSENPIEALKYEGRVKLSDNRIFNVQHGNIDLGFTKNDVWRISTKSTKEWLYKVEKNTWATFADIGKIRVGVKTTADKVFIRNDWEKLEEKPELLFPLTTHHCANRFKAIIPKKPKQILYPHQVVNGKRVAVNLDDYPKTKKYLEEHREKLESRTYVIESGRKWYEIWVPQDPDAWNQPKIIFRDISEEPTFWMDLDGSIVNGDCYWFTVNDSNQVNLLWLALAVGNSKFIETFYDLKFNNKLYAGRRRFITQYVEKFPLPDPELEISKMIIEKTKAIYYETSPETKKLEEELNALVQRAFNV
jgi:Predicted helicase